MRTIQINEAATTFNALLAAVEAGEAFALARHGRVVARLLPGDEGCGDRRAASQATARIAYASLALDARFSVETGLISPLD